MRTRQQRAHAEGNADDCVHTCPCNTSKALHAHAAYPARARRAFVVFQARNACGRERHTSESEAIGSQVEAPAGATRGGPSQPSYGPHVKARACVYAHPCVLGTHCPHPSLPHSTGTHTLSDTHTHTDQLVPHMHTRARCVSEAPGGAGKTGKSMRKHCRPSAPRAHICVHPPKLHGRLPLEVHSAPCAPRAIRMRGRKASARAVAGPLLLKPRVLLASSVLCVW